METQVLEHSPIEKSGNRIAEVFEKQKKNQYAVARTTVKERRAKLQKLLDAMSTYKPQIREALLKDFRKNPSEVDLTEIYPVTGEIKHAMSNLKRWMKNKYVATPIGLLGSQSHIKYEPKGVVLIISPWNFPINLTFGPLVSAIAAGNCVMIKPSEATPHASAIMKQIVEDLFDENEIAVFEGEVKTSTELLKLPFNHIFFTGSPQVGKIVMKAAAENLASVTLELGGKSPTIVDQSANIDEAATKIAWAKCINNGQICIAPDYLYIHKSKKDDFVKKFSEKVKAFYGEDSGSSNDYSRIVNEGHFERVKKIIADAKEGGATVALGGEHRDEDQYIAPTLLTDVKMDSRVMKEEIFGPVLPIVEFEDINEPINFINQGEKPLALYLYSNTRKNIKKVLNETRSGGACINESALHFFQNNLPFGGDNNSGIGKSHGEFGFQAFSNAKGVLKQPTRLSAIQLMMPPYSNFKQTLIDLSIKWF